MNIGFIGLGRMGGSMVKRLIGDGHKVIGFDIQGENVVRVEKDGAKGAESIEKLVKALDPPRHVWVMVPHGEPTRRVVEQLWDLVESGDLIVDGGNSRYLDSMKLAEECAKRGIHFLDAGVSGGIWGLKTGYNLMIGGTKEDYQRLAPVFKSLAPENGCAHVGPPGAGHFVKMIHNALEYAMLQAIGESFECLKRSPFNIDLKQIAELWRHGAVVRSWLLDLLVKAFEKEGNNLEDIADFIEDSGTGRWTTEYAVQNAIPVPALTLSLYERFSSRLDERFSAKVIAALRNQFGGHAMKEA